MNIYKKQSSNIDNVVLTNHYKPYEYTEKDCNNTYDSYDVFKIDSVYPIELKNGRLSFKNMSYPIGKLDIKDVIKLLNDAGITASIFTGYEDFQYLPAILLRDFTNIYTKVLDGGRSPVELVNNFYTNSIEPLSSKTITVEVTDSSGSRVNSDVNSNGVLFFEPSPNLKIHQVVLSDSFYAKIDFSPKRLTSKIDVAYLLNYKET